jgi:chromosome partitioning protein
MKVIAISNQKGGVAKTTATINIGAVMANLGYKVLIIDLDAQGNASHGLGFTKENLNTMTSIFDCIVRDTPLPIKDAIVETEYENLYLVPSNTKMKDAEPLLTTMMGRELLLKESFASCYDELDFDYVLLDFPPALGIVSLNGLIIADEVLIPVNGNYALEGINDLLETIKRVKRKFNPSLNICGAFFSMYTISNEIKAILEDLQNYFGDKMFKTYIRKSVKVEEAAGRGKPVVYYAPYCNPSLDYKALTKEVLEYVKG